MVLGSATLLRPLIFLTIPAKRLRLNHAAVATLLHLCNLRNLWLVRPS